MIDLPGLVHDIAESMARETDRGRVATYIPELAKVNANQFGIQGNRVKELVTRG